MRGGELRTENDAIRVRFPAGAVEVAHRLRLERIPSQVRPARASQQLVLAEFSLRAFERGNLQKETRRFKQPVTITVRYDPKMLGGWKEQDLALAYWDGDKKQWIPLPSERDLNHKTVSARTNHFTNFGLIAAPDQPLYIPKLESAETSLFTGAAAFRYELEVPPGRGGLVPRLTLAYASADVEMMEPPAQASFVGAGWRFSTHYIARDMRNTYDSGDDVFSLIADGARYELMLGLDGYYHTMQEQYWRIQFDQANNRWLVITRDGTQYQYGWSAQSRASVTRVNGGGGLKSEVYAWWLEKVIDLHSNEIAYTYLRDPGISYCGWPYDRDVNHDYALFPQVIRYNGTTQSGFLTQIELAYSSRTDVSGMPSQYQCGFAPAQRYKLDRVDVRTTVSGALQLVRRYTFTYDYSTFPGVWHGHPYNAAGRLTLKEIKQFGSDGQTALPAYTFTYSGNRLRQVSNNLGGSVTFDYNSVAQFNDNAARRGYAVWYPEGCVNSCNWTPHNVDIQSIPFREGSALLISSSGTGYAALRLNDFTPGVTYLFLSGLYGESPVRLRAYDGITETQLGPDGVIPANCPDCAFGGYFTPAHNAPYVEIRIYVQQGGVVVTTGQTALVPTYYRVSARTLQDGQGSAATSTYTYEGAALNRPENSTLRRAPLYTQFRGHSRVTVTDPTGAKTEYSFYQDDVKLGQSWKIIQRDASGNTYTQTEHTFAQRSIPITPMVQGDQSNFVYISQTLRDTYDGQTTYKRARTVYTYDSYGNLSQQDEYDENNTLYRRTLQTVYPNTTAWIVNRVGRVQVKNASDALVSETCYFYDQETNHTTPPTKGALRRIEVTPDGTTFFPQTRNTFDTYGNITSTTDARGNTTTIEYDPVYVLFPRRVTNALGHLTTTTYDYRFGKPLTVTDPNNAVTTYEYDVFGRTTKIWLPLQQGHANPTVRYTYTLGNPRSLVRVEVRDDEGTTNSTATYQSAWWFYDGLGRVIQKQTPSATSGQVILTNTAYDVRGKVWRVSNPYAVTASSGTYQSPNWSQPFTEHLYDPIGREIRTNNPDGTFQTITYNQWTTTFTDANNHPKQTIADAFGRTIQVKEFNAGQTYTTRYQYDTLNRLTRVTDHAGNLTTMTYDWLGRKIAMSDPDLGTWSYTYDNAGNLTRQTDARNQTTCFYYDALNRLKGKNYRNNTNCPTTDPGTYAVTYTYDGGTNQKGRRTGMSNAAGATSWTYDVQGRVLSQTDNITGAPATYTTRWTYDALNRVRTMTYPDGEQVTTTYNAQMLPQTLQGFIAVAPLPGRNPPPIPHRSITSAQYNAAGQLTALALGNGVTTTYTYHPQNLRLTQLTTGGNLQNLSYLYDNVGNITRITDAVRNETLNFAYDHLDRLTSVTGAYSQSWVYNAIGNITQFNGVNYTYHPTTRPHAVTQVGSTTYTYDANGNMLSRGADTFQYDYENRLTQATVGGLATQYAYNADGARVKRVMGSTTTYYIGNWFEVTQAGAVTKYYYFNGKRVAMQYIAPQQGGVLTYLHTDHLGSTSVASTASGALVARQTYYAYGAPRTSEGTLPTDYTFTGQRVDTSAGLMYYGARYYDAALGRFIQADTIIPDFYNPQDLNRYTYTRNNPVRYTDPSGRVCIPCLIGFGVFLLLLPGDTGPYPADPVGDFASDIALRTAFEPYDWIRTGQECLSGQCNAVDVGLAMAPLLPGGLGRVHKITEVTTRAEGKAYSFVLKAAQKAEEVVAQKGLLGSLEKARGEAEEGKEILSGLFKYSPKPEFRIDDYQQHHLWPIALGGPEEGWVVYARNYHTATGRIQKRLDDFLTGRLNTNLDDMRKWARQNPEKILPLLREFYQHEGIPFPY